MTGSVEAEPVGVEIAVVPRSPGPGYRDRMHRALRAEGLVGVVYPFSDDVALHAWILLDDAGLALRATADDLQSGLELATIAARLSRALDAAVLVDTCELPVPPRGADDDGELRVVPPGLDLEAALGAERSSAPDDTARAIALVPLPASTVAARFPEAALGTRASTALVPDGDRSIVITEGPRPVTWWKAALPIVRLVEAVDGTEIEVLVHKRWLGFDRGWSLSWGDPPIGIQPREHAAAAELQVGLVQSAPYVAPSQDLVHGLGWDARTLDQLRSMVDQPRPTLLGLAMAIGGSPALLRIAAGSEPEREPGSTVYPRTTTRAVLADAVRQPDRDPDSGWSRYERWWRERPGASIVVGIAMLAVSVAIAAVATVAGGWTWWRAILCVVVLINGIGILNSVARWKRVNRSAD